MKRAALWLVLLLAVARCGEKSEVSTSFVPLASARHNRLAVLTATPTEGPGKLISLELAQGQIQVASHRVDSDPVMALFPSSHQVMVMNRRQGNVMMFERDRLTLSGADYRVEGTPNDINFQDAVDLGNGEAYLSSLLTGEIFRIQAQNGKVLKRIPLADYADPDGNADPAHMYRMGNRVAVVLQRLTGFVAQTASRLLILDSETDKLQHNILMNESCRNPFSALVPVSNDLLVVGCVGTFGENTPERQSVEMVSVTGGVAKDALWEGLAEKPVALDAISPLFLTAILMDENGGTRIAKLNRLGDKRTVERSGVAPYAEGYRSLKVDAERRLLWVGKAGKDHHRLLAISLDTDAVVQEIPLEYEPIQLEWLD